MYRILWYRNPTTYYVMKNLANFGIGSGYNNSTFPVVAAAFGTPNRRKRHTKTEWHLHLKPRFIWPLSKSWTEDLLIVQHDVRPPDVVGGHVEHVHSAVFRRIPTHFVVVPKLLHPQIGGHDLVSEVLWQGKHLQFWVTRLFVGNLGYVLLEFWPIVCLKYGMFHLKFDYFTLKISSFFLEFP